MQVENLPQSWNHALDQAEVLPSSTSIKARAGDGNGKDQAHDHKHNSHDYVAAIPPSKAGKCYDFETVFRVWFDVQAQVCDPNDSVKRSEPYKQHHPTPPQHLSLVPNSGPVSASHDVAARARAPPNLPPPAAKEESASAEDLLTPQEIQWLYLDPTGNEQGPFAGDVMQEWLDEGYLTLDLQIRRKEELHFKSLRTFCELVRNFTQPFLIPLPSAAAHDGEAALLAHELAQASSNQNVAASASAPFMSSEQLLLQLQHQHQQQQPQQPQQPQPQQQPFVPNIYSNYNGLGMGRNPSGNNQLFDFVGQDYLRNQQPLFAPQLASIGTGMGGGFGSLGVSSLLQQPLPTQPLSQPLLSQPLLSRGNSGWGLNTQTSSMPLSHGLVSQSGPISPWTAGVGTSRVSSPFVPLSTLAQHKEEQALHDMHSSMVTGILNDDERVDSRQSQVDQHSLHQSPQQLGISQQTLPLATTQQPRAQGAQQPRESPQVLPVSPAKTVPVVAPEPPAAAPEPVVKVEVATSQVAQVATQPTAPVQQTEAPRRSESKPKVLHTERAAPIDEPVQPVLAPWAARTETSKPALSLKQIQELEAERLENERQLRAEEKQERALAEALNASSLEHESAADKPAFFWASSQPEITTTTKTLSEIQKEEAEARALALLQAKVAAGTTKAPLAATLASTVPRDDLVAWTTVGSSKKPAPKKARVPAPVAPAVSYNPQALRAASSTATSVSPANANFQAAKEDFLIWARSAMTNLYPSVSKDDLLEIFTTLPLVSDSAQLIAETIYSSSATMDGRRFSQEFMKRRQQVERVTDGLLGSWSTAIASSANKVATVDDDGWSTTVKSKKKGKKTNAAF